MRPESGFWIAPSCLWVRQVAMTSQFLKIMPSSNFFDVDSVFLPGLVIVPSFMAISSLALELWQFPFIRHWLEIRKSDMPLSEFCSTSRDWSKLGVPNLERASLIKFD